MNAEREFGSFLSEYERLLAERRRLIRADRKPMLRRLIEEAIEEAGYGELDVVLFTYPGCQQVQHLKCLVSVYGSIANGNGAMVQGVTMPCGCVVRWEELPS